MCDLKKTSIIGILALTLTGGWSVSSASAMDFPLTAAQAQIAIAKGAALSFSDAMHLIESQSKTKGDHDTMPSGGSTPEAYIETPYLSLLAMSALQHEKYAPILPAFIARARSRAAAVIIVRAQFDFPTYSSADNEPLAVLPQGATIVRQPKCDVSKSAEEGYDTVYILALYDCQFPASRIDASKPFQIRFPQLLYYDRGVQTGEIVFNFDVSTIE